MSGREDLLLLGGSLLGGLLGGLLGCRLLGGLLGSWLLCGLLGLGSLLGSGLLGSLGLLGLLGLGLLGLGLLGGQLEASSSLLASSGSGNNLLGSDHLPEGELDTDGSLVSLNLVVGNDVLEDGLAGGSLLVLEGLDGGNNHVGVGRVSGRLGGLLGLGGFSFRHVGVVDLADLANLPM